MEKLAAKKNRQATDHRNFFLNMHIFTLHHIVKHATQRWNYNYYGEPKRTAFCIHLVISGYIGNAPYPMYKTHYYTGDNYIIAGAVAITFQNHTNQKKNKTQHSNNKIGMLHVFLKWHMQHNSRY